MPEKPVNPAFLRTLGAHLRQIRKKANLTLKQLAQKIAPDAPGYYIILHRLETGKIKNPSIITIANYLTACNASFNEIIELLNRSATITPKTETPPDLTQPTETLPQNRLNRRPDRIKQLLQNRLLRTILEDTLYRIITAPEAEQIDHEKLTQLCHYGRKIFQTYLSTRDDQDRRTRLLLKQRDRIKELDLPSAGIETIEQEIKNLYAEIEKQGLLNPGQDLLWIISELKTRALPASIRAEKRLILEKHRAETEKKKRIAGTAAVIFEEINRELKTENLDPQTRLWAIELLHQLTTTALQLESDPEKQKQELNRLLSDAPYPELARTILQLFEKTYPRYRHLAVPDENKLQEKT